MLFLQQSCSIHICVTYHPSIQITRQSIFLFIEFQDEDYGRGNIDSLQPYLETCLRTKGLFIYYIILFWAFLVWAPPPPPYHQKSYFGLPPRTPPLDDVINRYDPIRQQPPKYIHYSLILLFRFVFPSPMLCQFYILEAKP